MKLSVKTSFAFAALMSAASMAMAATASINMASGAVQIGMKSFTVNETVTSTSGGSSQSSITCGADGKGNIFGHIIDCTPNERVCYSISKRALEECQPVVPPVVTQESYATQDLLLYVRANAQTLPQCKNATIVFKEYGAVGNGSEGFVREALLKSKSLWRIADIEYDVVNMGNEVSCVARSVAVR